MTTDTKITVTLEADNDNAGAPTTVEATLIDLARLVAKAYMAEIARKEARS